MSSARNGTGDSRSTRGDRATPSGLSDKALLEALTREVNRSRSVETQLLVLIGEVDARGLYRQEACSSMYVYCTERLGLSEGAAYKRIRVARAARRYPVILDYVLAGRIHLAGLAVLVPLLTPANVEELLAAASGKSRREIEVLARELSPRPEILPTIRKLRGVAVAMGNYRTLSSSLAHHGQGATARTDAEGELSPGTVSSDDRTDRVEPLATDRYRVSFTASGRLKARLEEAQELAGFGVSIEGLFERAMDLLVEDLRKKRFGVSGRTSGNGNGKRDDTGPARVEGKGKRASRYIPKAIRREVYERDGGQCTYRDHKGRRCSERRALDYDHIRAHALGGENTAENLRLRCRAHNQLHAEACFGPDYMAEKRRGESPDG